MNFSDIKGIFRRGCCGNGPVGLDRYQIAQKSWLIIRQTPYQSHIMTSVIESTMKECSALYITRRKKKVENKKNRWSERLQKESYI